MPYKYIGREINHKGKSLWEILGNLKNFGVGRIVARNSFDRYPEPSYMKIVKVETLPEPLIKSYDENRKMKIWVEKTFRGFKHPELYYIESVTYKYDYKLIPKDEEEAFCKFEGTLREKIFPRTMRFPPLMRELILREMKANGELITKEPEMEVSYVGKPGSSYRVALENETPNVKVDVGFGTTVAPRLYKGIKL